MKKTKKQPKKSTLGKISWFLRAISKGGNEKAHMRRLKRGSSEYPNSSKVGDGTHYINRSNRNVLQKSTILRKRECDKGQRIINESKKN